MATGSGTGTPVSAGSAFTLNDLRDRIRTQIEAAWGFTAPLPVTASSIQLSSGTPNLRDRVESRLQDSGNSRWSTDDTDEAIRTAIEEYSQKQPREVLGTIALSADGREIDISSLTGLLRVQKVWWDYDSTTPGYPPNWRQFEVWPGSILYIDDRTEPSNGDTVRIWYTAMHTLNGLDSASATTIPEEDIVTIVTGAAYHAARARAIELAESLTIDDEVVSRLMGWAEEQGKTWRYQISLRPPAWQRRAYAHAQGDIDEAIRWALHRYNEVLPDQTITSIDLSADGREVDISSITDYLEILRVWWDYDSSDPEHPPRWRDFQLWPGNILWINDAGEPQSGDTVRIWYTRMHTVNGLDGAATTTLPEDAETLIVAGAAAVATQERQLEEATRYVPRKLQEWARQRLIEFERGLKAAARRRAARHSGIAPMPALDRWDDGTGWW